MSSGDKCIHPEVAIEQAIVDLLCLDSPLEVARRLVIALGGPDNLSAGEMLDWITERRGG